MKESSAAGILGVLVVGGIVGYALWKEQKKRTGGVLTEQGLTQAEARNVPPEFLQEVQEAPLGREDYTTPLEKFNPMGPTEAYVTERVQGVETNIPVYISDYITYLKDTGATNEEIAAASLAAKQDRA